MLVGADEVEEDILQRGVGFTCARAQLIQRALGDERALRDDADPRAETFHDLHDVRAEEDRRPGPRKVAQDVADDARTDRIDALEWLIEEEHLWAVDQRGG